MGGMFTYAYTLGYAESNTCDDDGNQMNYLHHAAVQNSA